MTSNKPGQILPAMKKLPVADEVRGEMDAGGRSGPLMCQGFLMIPRLG